MPVMLLGALVVQLREDIPISVVELGAVTALFYLVAALGSIPAGTLVDHLGWARSIWIATPLLTVPLLLVATVARSAWHVALLLGVTGVGNAIAQPAANLAIVRGVTPGRQGVAFGIKQAAIPAIMVASGAAVPLIALTVGWRWAFLLFASVILALVSAAPLREGDRHPRLVAPKAGQTRELLGDRALIALACANMGSALAINALMAFFVESSVVRGIPPAQAGTLLALGSATGIASRLIVGWLSDRYAPTTDRMLQAMAWFAAFASPGFVLLGAFGHRPGAVLVGLLLAIGSGFAWNGLYHQSVMRLWSDRPAAASGITQAGLWTGAMIGPLVFGLLATTSYAFAWYAGAVFMALSAGSLVVARLLLAPRLRAGVRS
jgi:MFS family permease